MNYTQEEIEQFKKKADKWDKLDEEIGKCYGYEAEDGEWVEYDEEDERAGDLIIIGELAANAFGWT